MQIVALRNGAQEDRAIVQMKMATLQSLRTRHPAEFRTFVLGCHNPACELPRGDLQLSVTELPPCARRILVEKFRVMTDDGIVPRAMRNVILSAAQVSGEEVTAFDPPYQF
jgi:hypothetical protein